MKEIPEVLEKLLKVFEGYYDINRETPHAPFLAEADFRMHDEQYFLIRSARLSETDTRELLFFTVVDKLTPEYFEQLSAAAWETGLNCADIRENHRLTDIGLIILAKGVPEETCRMIRKTRRTKSHLFGMRGYSRFRVLAVDLSDKRFIRNSMGDTLEKAVCQAMK